MNTFMNFVKRSLEQGGTRSRVGASGGMGASSLPALDLPSAPAGLFCSPAMSARRLTQGLRQVMQDPGTIAKGGGLNVILPNGLADPLGMELLEL